MNFERKIKNASADLFILKTISKKPNHGYGVIKNIQKKFNTIFSMSIVYPTLKELEKDGYLSSKWNFDSNHHKRIYLITDKGLDLLKKQLTFLALFLQKIKDD